MQRRVATVFGGAGFLGRHVVRRLALSGWTVRVAVRDPETTLFLRVYGDAGQIVAAPADITQPETVAAAVNEAEWVVNLVGILYEKGKQTFERVHVEGAATVAKAAAAAGVERLVHLSAIGANPQSEAKYARTKAAGEQAVLAAFPKAAILRPSVVFGPEDDFFNRFAGMARLSPILPVFDTRFQPVYVGDVAEAVYAALVKADAAGKTFELGGPRAYAFRELMEAMLRETRQHRLLLPTPLSLMAMQAALLEVLPVPPITRDQVKLLRRDNVVAPGALTLADLGVEATALEVILPTYIARFRAPEQSSRAQSRR